MNIKLWTHQHHRYRIPLWGLCLLLGVAVLLMPDPVMAALEASVQPLFGQQESVAGVDEADGVDEAPTVSTNCGLIREIPRAECEVLVDIYNSAGGRDWNESSNYRWFGDYTPCDWHSIDCSNGHITSLTFGGHLNGTLPSSIGDLRYLTNLSLHNNRSFTGNIPPEIGNLSRLTSLTIKSNSELRGGIPPELGNLSNLTKLIVSANYSLGGNIPPELGNLTNLTELEMYANGLSGNIPTELGSLTRLKHLELQGNQLSGSIPASLGNLVGLTELQLGNNRLTGELPSELGALRNIQHFTVNMNSLNGSIPTSYSNLNKITTFRFDKTGICESQNSSVRDWLEGLNQTHQTNRQCSIDDVCISVTDIALTECRAMESLYKSTSGADWNNNTGWFQNETSCTWFGVSCSDGHISKLELSSNELLGIIPPEIANLPSLTHLDLSNNQIVGSIPPEIGNLTNLQVLYLFNNSSLGGILPPEMGSLGALRTLYLDNTRIAGTIPTTVGNLSNLEYLNIRNNWIRGALPNELNQLSNLKLFFFNGTDICEPQETSFQTWLSGVGSVNGTGVACSEETLVTSACKSVTTIPISECMALESLYDSANGPSWTNRTNWLQNSDPCVWHGVTCESGHVKELRLEANNLIGSISPELGDLPQLTALVLNDNQINGRIPPELGNLENLDHLRLHNNTISGYIPQELGLLAKLETLIIHDNRLHSSLPAELGNLSALRIMNLSNNELSGSIPTTLGNLMNLNLLSLSHNQFSGSIPSTLGNLSQLQDLGLRNNQLNGSVPRTLGQLANLLHLSLDNNQLAGYIHPDLGNLFQLTHLWLNDNLLSSTLPMTFINLTNLSVFDFHNTSLKEIDDTAFQTWLNGVDTVNSTGEKDEEEVIPDECSDISEISPAECRALNAFYHITGGDGWTANTGWFQTNTPCSWHGITCSGGSVTELRLNNNNLAGGLPYIVSHLAALTVLDLSNNLLSGEIPAELGGLANLRHLDLQNNSLSGSLPISLYNLNLETLGYQATDICEPAANEFVTWIAGIANLNRSNIPCQLDMLTLEKTASTHIADLGDTVDFEIVVTAALSASLQLTDTLPYGLSDIRNLGEGLVYDAEQHQLTYGGDISAAQPLVLTYQSTVDPMLATGSILHNAVIAKALGTEVEDATTVVVPVNEANQTLMLVYAVGDNELSDEVFEMLNRIEAAANNPHVVTLVLVDGAKADDTYLYYPEYDTDPSCPSAMNMTCDGRYTLGKNLTKWTDNTANPYSLSQFIKTGIHAYPNADRIMLSLIGHGAGWAPNTKYAQPPIVDIQPDELGGLLQDHHPKPRSISTRSLGKAFQWAYQSTGKMIDLVYFDACSMGMWEVAYEVSPYVRYQMFSANTAWATFPYDQHVNAIDGERSVIEIGKAWIQNEVNILEGTYPFTFAMVESSQLEAIQSALKNVSDALIQALYGDVTTTRSKLRAAFDATERFESNYDGYINEYDNYGDLSSFAVALAQQFPDLSSQTDQLQNAIGNAVILQKHGSGRPWVYFREPPYPPNSVWNWNQIGGIGLYLPFNQDHDEWRRTFYTGSHVKAAQTGTWDELIAAFWDGLDTAAHRASRASTTGVTGATGATATAPPVCPPACDGMGAPLSLMPTLTMPEQVQTMYPQSMTLPIELEPYGNALTEGAFTLQFDNACLAIDPAQVVFIGATGTASLTSANQLSLTGIQSSISSTLHEGQLVTIPVTPICTPQAGTSITTAVTITSVTFVDEQSETLPGADVNSVITIHNESTEGDINGDEAVNIFDLQILINMIAHNTPEDPGLYPLDQWQRAELNGDGAWNIFDLQMLINLITQ
ncbi:MAG: leucine-rich repeat domain-containing protein [Chloroflexota bacterium]